MVHRAVVVPVVEIFLGRGGGLSRRRQQLLPYVRRQRSLWFRSLSCRWSSHSTTTPILPDHHSTKEHQVFGSRLLLCGEGDLSYAASVSSQLASQGIHLTATVLEDSVTHASVYEKSKQNKERILRDGHEVGFATDATQLRDHFSKEAFDTVQFNFPHWKGKANNKHNRALLSDFFASASQVLAQSGQVHVALFDHQGSAYPSNLSEWKSSWIPSKLAAEHNLLLMDVYPFEPNYRFSAWRWTDKSFHLRSTPQMYVFGNVKDEKTDHCYTAKRDLQLYSYFEIYVDAEQPPPHDDDDSVGVLDPMDANAMQDLIQTYAPPGIRIEAHLVNLLDGTMMKRYPNAGTICAYKIFVCGESKSLTRDCAETWRLQLEQIVLPKYFTLRPRGQWPTSQVFPYILMNQYTHDQIDKPI